MKLSYSETYYRANREFLCFMRGGRYSLRKPNGSVRYAYIRKLRRNLRADTCLVVKLCAWFTCQQKSGEGYVGNKSAQDNMPNSCRKSAFSALERRKKSVGELLHCVRSINCMKILCDGFGDSYHTLTSEPWLYDTAYNVIKHECAIPINNV